MTLGELTLHTKGYWRIIRIAGQQRLYSGIIGMFRTQFKVKYRPVGCKHAGHMSPWIDPNDYDTICGWVLTGIEKYPKCFNQGTNDTTGSVQKRI